MWTMDKLNEMVDFADVNGHAMINHSAQEHYPVADSAWHRAL